MGTWIVAEEHLIVANSPEEALEKVHNNQARFVSATITLQGIPNGGEN